MRVTTLKLLLKLKLQNEVKLKESNKNKREKGKRHGQFDDRHVLIVRKPKPNQENEKCISTSSETRGNKN